MRAFKLLKYLAGYNDERQGTEPRYPLGVEISPLEKIPMVPPRDDGADLYSGVTKAREDDLSA